MRRRVRVREGFAINPPYKFCLPMFKRSRRRSGNPSTGLDRYNAMRETDIALRRYEESLGGRGLFKRRVHRKGGIRKQRKIVGKRGRVSMKQKMARVRSFKKGGKKVMAKHRGRPRKRHRITRHFGRRIGVSNVSVLLNPRKRHKKYSRIRSRRHRNPLSIIGLNPRSRHHRKRYRNPADSAVLSGGKGMLGTAKQIIPLGITAGIGGVVTKLAPGFLGAGVLTNQWMRYGVQVGVGVVGCLLVGKFVNKQHGVAFGIGAVSIIVMDLIQGWLLTSVAVVPAGTAGVGVAPGSYVRGQYQYPGYPGRVGAFTNQRIPGNVSGVGTFADPYHG